MRNFETHFVYIGNHDAINALAVFGFLTGGMMAWVVASVLISAVSTIYVAFADEPQALRNNHPDEFSKLYDAWNKVCIVCFSHIISITLHSYISYVEYTYMFVQRLEC